MRTVKTIWQNSESKDLSGPRRSGRPRVLSGHYVSVECRPRIHRSRKSPKKYIKQEPEDEPSPSTSQIICKTKSQKISVMPKRHSVRIKMEPEDVPCASNARIQDLPLINDDLEFIQQSITSEPGEDWGNLSMKRGKKSTCPEDLGHKCKFCGRMYAYRKGLLQHQRLECGLEPQFPCPYCPQKFRYRHLIRNHVFEEHKEAYDRWYRLFYVASKLPRWPEKDTSMDLSDF